MKYLLVFLFISGSIFQACLRQECRHRSLTCRRVIVLLPCSRGYRHPPAQTGTACYMAPLNLPHTWTGGITQAMAAPLTHS